MAELFNRQKFTRFWHRIYDLSVRKNLYFNASSVTFNLFICAIPFTLILISITGYILSIEAAFNEVLRFGRELFPDFTYESDGDLLEGAVTLEKLILPLVSERRTLGILGFASLIIFAQALFHTLKHVLFDIYDIEERKHPVVEFIYSFFTFGIVGGAFIFFSMAISFISLLRSGQITIPFLPVILETGRFFDFLTIVIPVIFTFLLFYIIYRYISEKRMGIRVALTGAAVYTFLFELAKFAVSYYLEYAFTFYQYLYQGYAAMIVIGFWAFYSALLFIVAAIVARAFEEVYLISQPAN